MRRGSGEAAKRGWRGRGEGEDSGRRGGGDGAERRRRGCGEGAEREPTRGGDGAERARGMGGEGASLPALFPHLFRSMFLLMPIFSIVPAFFQYPLPKGFPSFSVFPARFPPPFRLVPAPSFSSCRSQPLSHSILASFRHLSRVFPAPFPPLSRIFPEPFAPPFQAPCPPFFPHTSRSCSSCFPTSFPPRRSLLFFSGHFPSSFRPSSSPFLALFPFGSRSSPAPFFAPPTLDLADFAPPTLDLADLPCLACAQRQKSGGLLISSQGQKNASRPAGTQQIKADKPLVNRGFRSSIGVFYIHNFASSCLWGHDQMGPPRTLKKKK